jgi:hypothetical protein
VEGSVVDRSVSFSLLERRFSCVFRHSCTASEERESEASKYQMTGWTAGCVRFNRRVGREGRVSTVRRVCRVCRVLAIKVPYMSNSDEREGRERRVNGKGREGG